MVDSTFHWINDYPLDNSMGFDSSYPVNSNLLAGYHYLTFKHLRPGSLVHSLTRDSTYPYKQVFDLFFFFETLKNCCQGSFAFVFLQVNFCTSQCDGPFFCL